MKRSISLQGALLLGATLAIAAADLARADTASGFSDRHDYRVVTVTEDLARPWSIAFLPGGDMLVTEKAGTLRVIRDGSLLEAPIAGVPEVHNVGQGGLLDVLVHPDYETNGWIYLSYAKPQRGDASTTAVLRGRLEAMRLVDQELIFEANSTGRGHYGSRLLIDPQGYLFITIGDRQASPRGALATHPAQDLSSHQGVIVRLHDDGRVPADNPFRNEPGALPEIWSYGHRNPQGMVLHPGTGELWITEHGPEGGDELNRVEGGSNYGWPVIGFGVNYGGAAIHERSRSREGMIDPVKVWVPSIGVSGLASYQGVAFPGWNGLFLAGGLSGNRLDLVEVDGDNVVYEDILLRGYGRIRDVRVGPDGYVYLALDRRADGPSIVRLEPVPRAPIQH